MTLAGFKARNHPQQTGKRGADDATDDRAITMADFEPLHARFRFTIDAAASQTNARLERYWTRDDDALTVPWSHERVWCNPPYSGLDRWVGKAWHEMNRGPLFDGIWPAELVVMLLPANRTEQRWWQDHIEPHRDRPGSGLRVEFLPGRMRFDRPGVVIGPKGDRPPFGCCLAIWERTS